MYCDTDSVIYIQPRSEPPLIETGDKLGDMTYELRPSESISEYACGGPRNYAYRVLNTGDGREKTVYKIRGITLNYNTMKMVNFGVVRDMIMGDEPPVINVHSENKIKRKRKRGGTMTIVTEPETRQRNIVFQEAAVR